MANAEDRRTGDAADHFGGGRQLYAVERHQLRRNDQKRKTEERRHDRGEHQEAAEFHDFPLPVFKKRSSSNMPVEGPPRPSNAAVSESPAQTATGAAGSTLLELDALVPQQPPLALEPAAISDQRTIGADQAMAGHDNADRIGAIGVADRAHRPGHAELSGKRAVSSSSSLPELPAARSRHCAGTPCRRPAIRIVFRRSRWPRNRPRADALRCPVPAHPPDGSHRRASEADFSYAARNLPNRAHGAHHRHRS